jgi:hypothetical protein
MDDQQLEQALHDAAPAVDASRVLDRVAAKRARRRTVRRIESGVVALVVVTVIGLTAVLTTRDDGPSPHVASPGASLSARVVEGGDVVNGDAGRVEAPTPVDLDTDPGALRGPLVVGSAGVSVAAYDRSETGLALSHVVRVDGTHVVDVVDFKAEIISITEGEGARWAVTRNLRATGGTVPDAFLKRIPASGIATSTQLPLDADPVGPVAAIGGAVWVPTRAGVVQYDTNGDFVRSIRLDPADARSVAAIGKFAWVTDGAAGLRRLDPSTGATSDTHVYSTDPLVAAAGDVQNGWLLAGPGHLTFVGPDLRVAGETSLPDGFTGSTVTVANGRAWVTGRVGGAPAIVLLDAAGVRATVILQNAGPATDLAWSAPHMVTAVTNGSLVRVSIP